MHAIEWCLRIVQARCHSIVGMQYPRREQTGLPTAARESAPNPHVLVCEMIGTATRVSPCLPPHTRTRSVEEVHVAVKCHHHGLVMAGGIDVRQVWRAGIEPEGDRLVGADEEGAVGPLNKVLRVENLHAHGRRRLGE